jgi:murein DD-endopeptidase MepM/ murein hydrolase activator NlpD
MEALPVRSGYTARRLVPYRSVPGRPVSGRSVPGRGYGRNNRDDGLRRLITFQALICILLFFIVVIAKNVNISAAKSFTEQIRYVLTHNIEMNRILAYADNLVTEIRNSIIPGSVKTADSQTDTTPVAGQPSINTQTSGNTQTSNNTQTLNNTLTPRSTQTSDIDQIPNTAPVSGESLESESSDSTLLSGLWQQETDSNINPVGKSVLSASSESGAKPDMIQPVTGTLATPFGKINHGAAGAATHMGIDIHTEKQSSVKAVMDGKVLETGSSPAFGNYIRILHDNGYETVYAYCSVLTVQEGDIISKGDVIAQIGDQNISSGQHLHFEIWKDGEAVDPIEYISVTIK